MLVHGAWNRVDVDALHDASALLRARPGELARYFPEGVDAPYQADAYQLGSTDARTALTDELAQLATSFRQSSTLLRRQPGLSPLADSIDGAAAVVTDGSAHVASNQIHSHARKLQAILNGVSRIAVSIDGVAQRGVMPGDQAATRARILELTERPFGRQGMDELHELAVLADDLPAESALPRPQRAAWDKPLRDYLHGSTDPEYAASLRAVQVARVAELHSRVRYPDLDAAVGRIDELLGHADELDLQDSIELYGLLHRTEVRRVVDTFATQRLADGIGNAVGFLDTPATTMEQARLAHHLGQLATLRLASSSERAHAIADDALRVPRAKLDGMSAGRIEGLLDLAPELRPIPDRLYVPTDDVGKLLRAAGGGETLWLRPNTDQAWADATLDSALLGMRAEVELVRTGRLSTEPAAAPARLAELARGSMSAADVLEAQHLTTRLGDGVLATAGATTTGRVALGVRLATAELLQFGNEAGRLDHIHGYLVESLAGLDDLERAIAGRPSELAAARQLRELLERNIARIDGTGPKDGYLRHPDAAEVGRAGQLAQLLDRIEASRGSVDAGTELLTW